MAFSKAEYNNNYNKQNYIGVSFRVHKHNDKDIADALKGQENMKEYICRLIRADVRKRQRRKGWSMNNGNRKIHKDIARYPFEVVEFLAFNDRYTVGFTQTLEAAESMMAWYVQHNTDAGPLAVYCRRMDRDHGVNAVYAVQVI